mgnify:CR=1 FL=1
MLWLIARQVRWWWKVIRQIHSRFWRGFRGRATAKCSFFLRFRSRGHRRKPRRLKRKKFLNLKRKKKRFYNFFQHLTPFFCFKYFTSILSAFYHFDFIFEGRWTHVFFFLSNDNRGKLMFLVFHFFLFFFFIYIYNYYNFESSHAFWGLCPKNEVAYTENAR